jgi:hypothetical protein
MLTQRRGFGISYNWIYFYKPCRFLPFLWVIFSHISLGNFGIQDGCEYRYLNLETNETDARINPKNRIYKFQKIMRVIMQLYTTLILTRIPFKGKV